MIKKILAYLSYALSIITCIMVIYLGAKTLYWLTKVQSIHGSGDTVMLNNETLTFDNTTVVYKDGHVETLVMVLTEEKTHE